VFIAIVWVFPQGIWGAVWSGLRRVSNGLNGGDEQ
jgi:hypothetical protein